MMPSSVVESWTRACCCWWGGKTSITLSMAWGALGVCSVVKTRCPVSAAVSTVAMVSRSRISPTRMTSGSWRRACFRPAEKDQVSMLTSLCEMKHFLFSWTYSMGSSMVTTRRRFRSFKYSIIAASVVDLPLPAGPVTSMRPRSRMARVLHTSGSRSWSMLGTWEYIMRKHRLTVPFCTEALTRKRPIPLTWWAKSSSSSW